MTMAEIIVSAYLIIGGLAASVIWAALIASKRRNDKVAKANYDHLGFSAFRSQNTKPRVAKLECEGNQLSMRDKQDTYVS